MSKLVTIYGGSGFLGRYVAQRMARAGWRIRIAVRRPGESPEVRTFGTVGQVEPILCNVRNENSVRAAMVGADAVVNCAGILNEIGANSFDAVQNEGATTIARVASEQGVARLIHLSAIGASEDAPDSYSQSKALGEKGVLENFPSAIILRPSVVFGAEDAFFNKFAKMTRLGPIMALVGAETRMQPVHVSDVAQAVVLGVTGQAATGLYELGGPDVLSLREIVNKMLSVIGRRRLVLNLPFWLGSIVAGAFDAVQGITLGLVPNGILTRDQVRSLKSDNVVSDDAMSFADLGIEPSALAAILPEYLWPYRQSGQFAAIKDSAKNLKT